MPSLGPFPYQFFRNLGTRCCNSLMGTRASIARSGKDCPRAQVLFAVLRKEHVFPMIGLLIASSALHAQERRPTRGERLALEGRCEIAVPELERELELVPAPESAHVAWRLGQCRLRARDYARAAADLERALAIDPSLAEANLDLARARYHAGDLDGADAALRAGESLSGEALWQLYRGMVDLGRGDPAAAVSALQLAVDINAATFQTRADPEAVEPVASYYLGLALRAAGEEDRARERLHGVADAWGGTHWANEANRALGRAGRRAWVSLGTGLGYIDNVVLTGREAPFADEITDRSDLVGALAALGGIDLGSWGDNSAGVLASYSGRIHANRDDLREFDAHIPTASLWLNRKVRADTHLRFRYDFAYAWVDTDPFRISNGGRLALVHAWTSQTTTEVFSRSFVDDYRTSFDDVPDGPGVVGGACGPLPSPYTACGPRLLNEHRARDYDGYGNGGGFSHAFSLPLGSLPIPDPLLTTGYAYTYFESDGRESSYQEHRAFLDLGFALPHSIGLDFEGSYAYRAYRHPTVFPERDDVLLVSSLTNPRQYFLSDQRHHDQRFRLEALLAIPVSEPYAVSLGYVYQSNESTSDAFDYDSHAVFVMFTAYFARAL